MTRRRWIARAALRAVPRDWRDHVERDLADEGAPGVVGAGRALRIGLRFRAVRLREGGRAVFLALRGVVGRPSRYREMKPLALVIRGLLRAPVFTATAVLALGLGIGASTAVFSVADGILFRPLPYASPDRLVSVNATIRARDMLSWDVPFAEYEAWRDASRHLTGLAGFTSADRYTLGVSGALVEMSAASVTPGFLSTLGVPPALGRDLGKADFSPAAPRTLLILDKTWRGVFQADPGVVGRVVSLNGAPTTIVGVLPASFALPTASTWGLADGLVPYDAGGSSRRLQLVGRLTAGSTADDVAAELDPLALSRAAASGLRDTPIDGAAAMPLSSAVVRPYQRTLMLLLVGAAFALLLIGCANVANLLFARGADRAGELALRAALGADRGSLVRLLLLESSVLAATGGLVGVGAAFDGSADRPKGVLYRLSQSTVHTSRRQAQQVPRRKLADALEYRAGRGDAALPEEQRQRLPVDLGRKAREKVQGTHFRGKHKATVDPPIIERLDAESVTSQPEFPLPTVPKGESKHTDEAAYRGLHPPVVEGRKDDFGIGVSTPGHPLFVELGTQGGEVVHLAVVNQHETTAGRNHRLMPLGSEVKYGQSAVAEGGAGLFVHPYAAVVRAAVVK
jgi:hypothetical protein